MQSDGKTHPSMASTFLPGSLYPIPSASSHGILQALGLALPDVTGLKPHKLPVQKLSHRTRIKIGKLQLLEGVDFVPLVFSGLSPLPNWEEMGAMTGQVVRGLTKPISSFESPASHLDHRSTSGVNSEH